MLLEDVESDLKIIIVGNGSVGKTTLIQRFTTGEYIDTYKKTIGAAFSEKEHYVEKLDKNVTFMCWDTAGQEEFDSVTKRYYRGAKGCILAFSTTDRGSFSAVERWNEKVVTECGSNVPTVLIQTKVDLLDQSNIKDEEVRSLSERLGFKFFRCSTKNNWNVNEIFDELAEQHFNNPNQGGDDDDEIALGDTDDEAEPNEKPFVGHKDDSKESVIKLGEPQEQTKPKKKIICSVL